MEKATELIYACWSVLGQMSPYLILGFLISGILSVMISPRWVEKHLGRGRVSSVIKATLFGVPLPLCSCGVIPVSASLRRHGASKGATTSFLISTPQTGVDSILATYGLLGPFFAVFRPLAAIVTGIIGGLAVSFIDNDPPVVVDENLQLNGNGHLSFKEKVKAALNYGFVTIPGEIAKAMFVGIIIAGLISTFISGNFVSQYIGNYYLTMLLMLAIGIPLYVCSTSSIPIALGFMHMGVTPGAAFVFLISGPASNAAAITVIWKILGRTSAVIYLLTLIFGALAGGFAIDYLDKTFAGIDLTGTMQSCHTALSMTETLSAVLMLAILLFSMYKSRTTQSCCSSCATSTNHKEEKPGLTISVNGMSCNNCAEAVKRVILETPGVSAANVMLSEKKALVFGSELEAEKIVTAINSLGYDAHLPH
ncbi:MAG: heavy metal-associated domain-containing protein [Erysipelotrichia bacterium]|nr:heavy metal-associated domain-containing protein [Erysipelotrichia bacterium]